MIFMSDKTDEHMIEEPIEKTLVTFCSKTGISMDSCRIYYKQLEKMGKVKEKNSYKL